MINVRPGTGITGQPIYHQRYNFGYMKDHMRELKDVKDIHDHNSVQRDLSIRKKSERSEEGFSSRITQKINF